MRGTLCTSTDIVFFFLNRHGREIYLSMQHSLPTSVVFLTIHDRLLIAREQRAFPVSVFFFFSMVSMVLTQCDFCAAAPIVNVVRNSSAEKRRSCWTEASVVRHTTEIANCVSSCSAPVPSLALCVVPCDQCDGNQCCPGFDGSVVCVGVFMCCVCILLCVWWWGWGGVEWVGERGEGKEGGGRRRWEGGGA